MEVEPPTGAWLQTTRRHGEALILVALIALGSAFLLAALRLDIGSLKAPGPGIYPLLIGSLLVLLCAIALVRQRRAGEEAASIDLGHSSSAAVTVAIAAAAGLYEPLGFLIVSTLLIAGLTWLFTTAGMVRSLLYGAALSLALQLVFVRVFKAQLPAGLLALP